MTVEDSFFKEMRLSRAFSVEFDKFWKQNPELIPPDLLKAYILLKQEYDIQMARELS